MSALLALNLQVAASIKQREPITASGVPQNYPRGFSRLAGGRLFDKRCSGIG